MSKTGDYLSKLKTLDEWDAFLMEESGLPGPRGNIELAQVVADEGDLNLFSRYITITADQAPTNTPGEFLAFCGTVGLGRLLAEGDTTQLENLKILASDARWRIREAVAMALQRLGDADMPRLITAMGEWSEGGWLEKRAAAAALCEPRLLNPAEYAHATLQILDNITGSIVSASDRHGGEFLALRKGLGYCWSVAVIALPDKGKALMEKWLIHPDKDIQWIMGENLKKARLSRMDVSWVLDWQAKINR